MKKIIIQFIIVLTWFLLPASLYSEVIISPSNQDEIIFKAQVKSLDEFIQRINGKETNLIFDNLSDSLKIRNTRFALIDFELIKNIQPNDSLPSIYEEFVNLIQNDSTIDFKLYDPRNYIEIICQFSMDKKLLDLNLKLRLEEDDKHNWRWGIFDVDGLGRNGLIDTCDILPISPVDHEFRFIGMGGVFNNQQKRIAATKSSEKRFDNLSFFYGLIYSGMLKYEKCADVAFICNQVPGFSFVVKDINRGKNPLSGWMIIDLTKLSDINKNDEYNNYDNEKIE